MKKIESGSNPTHSEIVSATTPSSGALASERPPKPPVVLDRERDQAELIAELGECGAHNDLGLVGRAYFVRSVSEWRWVHGPCSKCEGRAPRPTRPTRPSGPSELLADGRWKRMRSGTWRVPLTPSDARRFKVGDEVRFRESTCRIDRLATEGGSTVATVRRA